MMDQCWNMPEGLSDEEGKLEALRCLSCKEPRCETGCPTSMRIRDFIKEIKNDNLSGAYDIIRECSNLPSICSIVCPHEKQCIGHCILNAKQKPINCGALERYVVERVSKSHEIKHNSSLNVAVIGAGPAGISCAMELAKNGSKVTIFEATDTFGGVMTTGIPSYRLAYERVNKIKEEVENLGIQVCYNHKMTESQILKLKESYDAVFIGVGLPKVKNLHIKGEDLKGVYNALDYLKQVNDYVKFGKGSMPVLSKHTIVIGAGNVAMDAARCAVRNGSKVTVAYRRNRELAPATKKEIREAEAEGVIFKFLNSPVEIIGESSVQGLKVELMELGEADASGRSRPVGTGKYTILECESIISAIGQNPEDLYDMGVLKTDSLYLSCEDLKTNVAGIYAGGDIVLGAKTVVEAMACGKRAAHLIFQDLAVK
ncbi:MAG: FAD-dependent oxidoreductase [Anaeroplasmataceae bacterium]|nr:FAD-dependent oxidoreductase [Anaeroplasmataceae bacterium]